MKIDEYISFCLKTVTDLRHFIITETKKHLDAGESFEDIVIDLAEERFKPADRCYVEDSNALENAAHNICIEKLWSMVPCSIFTSRVVTVKAIFNSYEMTKSDGGMYKVNQFVKYIYDVVKSGEALTEATYLKNVFNVYAAELKDDEAFELAEVPRTYADGGVDGLFTFESANLKKALAGLECYADFDDCANLKLMKSWMNPDEFRLMMAWAYAAIHPCTVKSNIALLLWTGGGTGKSSIVAMMKYAMMLASGAKEEDIYFEIKGDRFDEDSRNWMPDGEIGLAKAALVNIDEATTKSIELYKDISGSADKNRLNLRLNYENAITYDIRGKFVFTTNKGLQLTSDDGSLLRRVAIIKHTEVKNLLGDAPKTNEEIVLEYKRQIPMMLKLGKAAVQEIADMGYTSIDSYAMKCESINKNLRESTSTSSNTEAYQHMWQMLEEDHQDAKKNGYFKLQGSALKRIYELVCEENGEDSRYFGNFKRFILEHPEAFVGENAKKQTRNFLAYTHSGDFEICTKNCNCIYVLHPLKQNATVKDELLEDEPATEEAPVTPAEEDTELSKMFDELL